MASQSHGGAQKLLWLTFTFQVVLLMVAGFTFWQVSRYVEFSFRRSVEVTAAQAVKQWYQHLQTLAESEHQLGSLERAHLLPIALLAGSKLVPAARLESESGPPVPSSSLKMKLEWPGDFPKVFPAGQR